MNVNVLAVFVAGLIHMFYGLFWYSNFLFGKAWMELTGQELKPAPAWMGPAALGHLAAAYVLAIIISLANAGTLLGGAGIGLMVGLGFFVPLELGELTWEKIPAKLALIRCGYHLTALALIGAILGVWR
jgi:hypothetical protein